MTEKMNPVKMLKYNNILGIRHLQIRNKYMYNFSYEENS